MLAIELTQEIGRCITMVTDDTKDTTYLWQQCSSMALHAEGECGLLPKYFTYSVTRRHSCSHFLIFSFVMVGQKK